MVELLALGAALAWLCVGYIISALICYPFNREPGETLKEYLKELF